MGYKRKARILFVSYANPAAPMAQALANSLGRDWMEARALWLGPRAPAEDMVAVLQEAGIASPEEVEPVLDERWLAWADLVVALDRAAAGLLPEALRAARRRCYPLADSGWPDRGDSLRAHRELRERIRCRIQGMIGGMRMLQGGDAG